MSIDTTIAAEAARSRKLRRGRAKRLARHAILLAWTGFIVFPVFWMILTSFKPEAEVLNPASVIPHKWTLSNWVSSLKNASGAALRAAEQNEP